MLRLRRRERLRRKEVEGVAERLLSAFGAVTFAMDAAVERAEVSDDLAALLLGEEILALELRGAPVLTVRGLLKWPAAKRWATVDMGAVPYVYNGADIMAPGIVDADREIAAGNLVWVRDERNKRPLAVSWPAHESLMAARRRYHRHHLYESAVGASLPVIDTLRSFVRTGDRVHRIEGSLSGTLGFVTSEVMKGAPLSLVVRWARELGYTEADPRDDLSGLDSARKSVILARELGLSASLEDVSREPLVPAELLQPGTLQDLYEALRRHDRAMAERCERLRREGLALRYLMSIAVEDGRGQLRLAPAEVNGAHRAAQLQGVEAYVAFTTDRHHEHPLVVQGAGVGGALTAGGVLAEILRLAVGHGAR